MWSRAPASSANLGPGFDTLAVALDLYVEVEIQKARHLSVKATGQGSEFIDKGASHLAARVAFLVLGHDNVSINIHSDIPVAKGLGSSAAVAVAAAAAAGSTDPLTVAAIVDGHPENAAASAMGGLVAAAVLHNGPKAINLPLDPGLAFVVLVPEKTILTEKARQVLPKTVSLSDAVFNLGRMNLLLAGLAGSSYLCKEATEDRLHQDFRGPLFPEAPQLLSRLLAGGALAVCWSGAGPSLLGICEKAAAQEVLIAGRDALKQLRLKGKAMLLHADMQGVIVADHPL
ncbi:MAG: homoserine kinase [Actinobacteria bacterium]|nr:homoserine kinase [Actinomycetota bacterium]MCL6104323.1 homoserine kinase [Actinomycetota bacterium]